jgi:hypothetical protein
MSESTLDARIVPLPESKDVLTEVLRDRAQPMRLPVSLDAIRHIRAGGRSTESAASCGPNARILDRSLNTPSWAGDELLGLTLSPNGHRRNSSMRVKYAPRWAR